MKEQSRQRLQGIIGCIALLAFIGWVIQSKITEDHRRYMYRETSGKFWMYADSEDRARDAGDTNLAAYCHAQMDKWYWESVKYRIKE